MNPRTWTATAGWGLFCACSWTWCIGMFLPVILIRDLGGAGFLAFAIPNLFGFGLAGSESFGALE